MSSSTDTVDASNRIDLLFSKFAAFYGHIWRSQFKDELFLGFAKKEWREALSEFSNVVLTQAIRDCREFYELPPTLSQIVHCCRQIKKRSLTCMGQVAFVPASREVVELNLKRCKAILAK